MEDCGLVGGRLSGRGGHAVDGRGELARREQRDERRGRGGRREATERPRDRVASSADVARRRGVEQVAAEQAAR